MHTEEMRHPSAKNFIFDIMLSLFSLGLGLLENAMSDFLSFENFAKNGFLLALKMPLFADNVCTMPKDLVKVENLKMHFSKKARFFRAPSRTVRAVDGVSFKISAGKTLGLVGESGCGKTTVGRTVLRLNRATSGAVKFAGQDVFSLSKRELRQIRPKMQIVFQDPYGSLSPRMTIGEIVGEAVKAHKIVPKNDLRDYIAEICAQCGVQKEMLLRYPHEFSGGQRQRVCIARALAMKPQFIVADEPVSALDVSIQAQIINLLQKAQKERGISFLFISHDLSVVRHLCDDVAVMYLGKIVEKAPKNLIFENPRHPYTQCLFSAIPSPVFGAKKKRILPKGEPPSAENPPAGCAFCSRCPYADEQCKNVAPKETANGAHSVCCHKFGFGEC